MMQRWLIQSLAWWISRVERRAWAALAGIALVFGACAWVAVDRYRMNADLGDLIEQTASWRVDFDRVEAAFPDLFKTAVVVVSGPGFKQVEDVARQIEAEVRRRPEVFRAVQAADNHPFFRDHALLYLDVETLEDVADRLAEAQPWLTAVAEDPSLRGLLGLLGNGIENELPSDADETVAMLRESAQALLNGDDPTLYWTNRFFTAEDTWRRLIAVKSNLDLAETQANARLMAELRAIIAAAGAPPGVQVGITGEVALAHEEIEAAVAGVQTAGWLAVALLAAAMMLGVRSLKIIIATFTMLLVGVVLTSAYAMLTVGEYNTLSIVFMVMFFGLGVDFAIHFSLRYQEAVNTGSGAVGRALESTTHSVGGAIVACTLTTALGFLGFWPTDYKGLADLGVISAGGIVIAGLLTFTLLPALFKVLGPIRSHLTPIPSSTRLVNVLIAHRGAVVAAIGVLAVVSVALVSQARFDYSVLALKDPQAQSMRTLRRLQEDGQGTDYALLVLSPDRPALETVAALPVVDAVVTLEDFVPEEQEDKLYVLEDMQFILASALAPMRRLDAPAVSELQDSVQDLVATIDAHDRVGRFAELRAALAELAQGPTQRLQIWQRGVISNLLEEIDWLRRALLVSAVGVGDLPAEVRRRFIGPGGERLAVVLPKENVAEVAAMSRFIEGVRAVAPNATGRPVIEWGVGGIVLSSFQQAMLFALASIGCVLLVMFRPVRYAVLVVVPLALAVTCTLALGVLLDMPLNMANILVMPLIFGLGVDNGVHVVDRYRGEGDVSHLMHSSTPRAVVLSALTTVGAFSALSLSPHVGTASIGLLLAVAVSLLLLFTVFLLPVLLSWLPAPAVKASAPRHSA